jgi:hypothetical protein
MLRIGKDHAGERMPAIKSFISAPSPAISLIYLLLVTTEYGVYGNKTPEISRRNDSADDVDRERNGEVIGFL